MIREALAAAMILVGALFAFLAAVGIVRMPDVFMRMQATTKATTFGVMLLMGGVAVAFANDQVTARSALVVVFVFLTAPVAAHMLARAAHLQRPRLYPGTLCDEMPCAPPESPETAPGVD